MNWRWRILCVVLVLYKVNFGFTNKLAQVNIQLTYKFLFVWVNLYMCMRDTYCILWNNTDFIASIKLLTLLSNRITKSYLFYDVIKTLWINFVYGMFRYKFAPIFYKYILYLYFLASNKTSHWVFYDTQDYDCLLLIIVVWVYK